MIGVPSSSFAPWFSQLAHLAATLSSHSGLPVHEIEKAKVLKKHAKIRPLPNSSVQLGFSAWKLAHAIKKADCARWRANAPLFVSASGFLIENAQLFAWNGEALALNDGASEFLADFSGTSLAGRVAQGMALLFLESKGYSYVGRFEAATPGSGLAVHARTELARQRFGLAQLRRVAPGDAAPQLEEEDSDAIDLVGLLFDNLMQDVRPNSPAAELLTRMQVPLLRVALQDKSFFTKREHPARQMLANIAETGAQWVGEDEVSP